MRSWSSTPIPILAGRPAIFRAADPLLTELLDHLFGRYPDDEAATVIRVAWRDTSRGIVLVLQALDLPSDNDVDTSVSHVVLREPYLVRAALNAEEHPFGIGVIHSHPEGASTSASTIDDEMDGYLASYFGDFAPGRPYVSLVAARDREGRLAVSGRYYHKGEWGAVTRLSLAGYPGIRARYDRGSLPPDKEARVVRLASAFGRQAARRLHDAVVAVIGAGGTGSPALEVMARAGVGTIVTVDPDIFETSNLERVHGSQAQDTNANRLKIEIQRRHLLSINPDLRLVAVRGRLPQGEVLDIVVSADVVLGCTDSQAARVALSDLSRRFLVPVIDVGVALEGSNGSIVGQVIQLARMLPSDRCVFCREMVDPVRVTEELMPEDEACRRRAAANLAATKGEKGEQYWRGSPQLNTVGYLTTAAGALAAGHAIGWLSGTFKPLFETLQVDLSASEWAVANRTTTGLEECHCNQLYGVADQGIRDALIVAPAHWPACEIIGGRVPRELYRTA